MTQKKLPTEFQYDVLVDRQNICNRRAEIRQLVQLVKANQRVILYAPRRYGKSSLVRNVVAEDFLKTHSKAVLAHFNFMDVSSLGSLAERLDAGVTEMMTRFFSTKRLITEVISYFKNLTFTIGMDPTSNSPTFEIKGGFTKTVKRIDELFAGLKKIGQKHPLLLAFDEFQDIGQVPEAEANLRSGLQQLTSQPVIILGSKKALLAEIFSNQQSPFFNYGFDMHLEPIAVDDWLPYFNERLKPTGHTIKRAGLSHLSDLMCEVPNAICEVGFWLQQWPEAISFDVIDVERVLNKLIRSKEHSLRYQMTDLSESEKSVVVAIARAKYVDKISSKHFLSEIKPVMSATRKIVDRLVRRGLIEWEMDKGYRLSDPILRYFLLRFPV